MDAGALARALAEVAGDAPVDHARLDAKLLSSQPLAFNLFAPLAAEPGLATATRVLPGRITRVERIRFEHSPGRADPSYLDNKCAFDVFFEYTPMDGGRGFLGVEVKYHEDLRNPVPRERKQRYDEVADLSRAFLAPMSALWSQPPWQIWLDHLLALSLLHTGAYDEGAFVLLAPAGNAACRHAAQAYRRALADESTFLQPSLEDVLATLLLHDDASWAPTCGTDTATSRRSWRAAGLPRADSRAAAQLPRSRSASACSSCSRARRVAGS